MFISDKHKFIFLGIPRTGTTSMYTAFRKAIPGGIYTGKHDTVILDRYRSYTVAACVRNPYSREVSHYLYRHTKKSNSMYPACKDWSFENYVMWHIDRKCQPLAYKDKPQSTHLANVHVDILMRFENIDEDFKKIPIVKKLRLTLSQHNGRLKNKPWRPFYNKQLARYIRDWAAKDFEVYGYAKGSWR